MKISVHKNIFLFFLATTLSLPPFLSSTVLANEGMTDLCKTVLDLMKENSKTKPTTREISECLAAMDEKAKALPYPEIDWKAIAPLITGVKVYDGEKENSLFRELSHENVKLFQGSLLRVGFKKGFFLWKGGRLVILKFSNGKSQKLLWSHYGGFFILPENRNGIITLSAEDIEPLSNLADEIGTYFFWNR